MQDQNVSPRVGGGDHNKTPRKGAKSAPSDAPKPRPQNTGSAPGSQSAPTEAPAVRKGVSIPSNGDPYTPTSVKNTQVAEPPQPPGPDRSRS